MKPAIPLTDPAFRYTSAAHTTPARLREIFAAERARIEFERRERERREADERAANEDDA